ncbi:hypothetical protein LUZ63_006936 [Rhynchospora breviuscula]|uniref:GRF-type domain-containing protein n=1 Tax=Rhynchospora breviuscula TaxID=2022672 RepID=A0A9Q0CQQ3_9POAL|nr:hypothetical protein LUZ63_006936 [Rhynchospora breviuscula]
MHRRLRDAQSVLHSASSSVSSQPSRSEGLPLVPCPDCGVTVKKLMSRTESNPNRWFYKCSNKRTRCNFWMWDNEYESYAINANVEALNSDLLATVEAQLENLTDEFKKKCQYDKGQIRALVASLDKMKLYNAISVIVIVTLLMVLIALLIVD